MTVVQKLKKGLVVSCQALEGEPFHGPMFMAAFARAAALGGAVGIRTNGVQEVEVCKQITGLPVIGIHKILDAEDRMCITPTFSHAKALVYAGAAMVALDARRERPFGEPLDILIPKVRSELHVPVLADCKTLEDAKGAIELGADMVSTTFGYMTHSLGIQPDFNLLEELCSLSVPVIAEGGFWCPKEAKKALSLGAWAVVIGAAITRPLEITKRFVRAMEDKDSPSCLDS